MLTSVHRLAFVASLLVLAVFRCDFSSKSLGQYAKQSTNVISYQLGNPLVGVTNKVQTLLSPPVNSSLCNGKYCNGSGEKSYFLQSASLFQLASAHQDPNSNLPSTQPSEADFSSVMSSANSSLACCAVLCFSSVDNDLSVDSSDPVTSVPSSQLWPRGSV